MLATKSEDVEFKFYVLALFDILNQSALLRRLECLPSSADDPAYSEFVQASKKTIGTIDWFRKSVKEMFSIFLAADFCNNPRFSTLSGAQKSALHKHNYVELQMQSFSDLVAMFSPLRGADGHLTIRGIYAFLCTCATLIMVGFAKGVAIRGAIEVGIGAEFWPGELYGPVLFNAYRLESTIAQYPRIVVGQKACQYMTSQGVTTDASPADLLRTVTAQLCKSLVCIDHDGAAIVHFLGEGFREIQGECVGEKYPTTSDCVKEGLAFVTKEHKRFKKEGNHKLALRYALLRQYYESHKHLWL